MKTSRTPEGKQPTPMKPDDIPAVPPETATTQENVTKLRWKPATETDKHDRENTLRRKWLWETWEGNNDELERLMEEAQKAIREAADHEPTGFLGHREFQEGSTRAVAEVVAKALADKRRKPEEILELVEKPNDSRLSAVKMVGAALIDYNTDSEEKSWNQLTEGQKRSVRFGELLVLKTEERKQQLHQHTQGVQTKEYGPLAEFYKSVDTSPFPETYALAPEPEEEALDVILVEEESEMPPQEKGSEEYDEDDEGEDDEDGEDDDDEEPQTWWGKAVDAVAGGWERVTGAIANIDEPVDRAAEWAQSKIPEGKTSEESTTEELKEEQLRLAGAGGILNFFKRQRIVRKLRKREEKK